MQFDHPDPNAPPRAADFDEQVWPHYVALFALATAIGLSITNAALTYGTFENPFYDPYPLYNVWVHYAILAACVMAWLVGTAFVSDTHEHRRLLLAMALAAGVLYAISIAIGAVMPPTPDVDFAPVLGVLSVVFAPVLAYRLAGRYPGTHAMLVFLGAAIGGAVAWYDLRGAQAIGAALAGALAAHLSGGVVLGVLGTFAAVRGTDEDDTSALSRQLLGVVRLGGIAVLVVVLYESYWFLNANAIASANDVATRICQAADSDDTAPALRAELRFIRLMRTFGDSS